MNNELRNETAKAAPKRKTLPKLRTLSNTKGLKSLVGGENVGITLTCRVTLNLCNTHPCGD